MGCRNLADNGLGWIACDPFTRVIHPATRVGGSGQGILDVQCTLIARVVQMIESQEEIG